MGRKSAILMMLWFGGTLVLMLLLGYFGPLFYAFINN